MLMVSSLSARRGWVLLSSGARGCPAASNFLLLRQKKVTKEKATRSLGPYASLRATCGARLRRGLAQTRFAQTSAIPDPPTSALLGPARTGQSGSGTEDRNTKKTNTNKDTPWRVLVGFGIRGLSPAVGYSCPTPFWMRRGAQGQADQGSRCLSEAQRSEFSETPPGPSTAGCPQRSGGTQQVGSPFLLLTFLLAKQKKSELLPGNPRPASPSKDHSSEDRQVRSKGR